MMQFGVVLKSMRGRKQGILVLLDDANEALEISAELQGKGIDVEVVRMVQRPAPYPADRAADVLVEAPISA